MEADRPDSPTDHQPDQTDVTEAATDEVVTSAEATDLAEATDVAEASDLAEATDLAEADQAAMEALVEDLEAVAETAAEATDEGDTTFSEDLDPATLAFGAPKPQAIVCQWCNGPLEATDLEVCPHCGSRLRPTDENLVVPGVTTLSSEAARALELAEIQRNRQAAQTGQAMYTTPGVTTAAAIVPAPDEATIEAANRPPDEEVRRLMLEMEAEARRARAVADVRFDVESMIVEDAAERIEAETAESEAAAPEAEAPEAEAEAAESEATTSPGAESGSEAAAPDAPPDAEAPSAS